MIYLLPVCSRYNFLLNQEYNNSSKNLITEKFNMFLTLLVTLLFLVSVECKQNSLCHLKTYSVPCNPSTSCSHVEVLISVNEIENGECLFNITLIAYNMYSNRPLSVRFSFLRQNITLDHICTKYNFGDTTAKIYAGHEVYKTGSSIYMNGNLICTWIALPFKIKKPSYDIEILETIHNVNYSLALRLNETYLIIARDSSELPWHQVCFTKCGSYQLYGNHEYRLRIKKATNDVQLWIEPSKEASKTIEVLLVHRSRARLVIECVYFRRIACAFLENSNNTRFYTQYFQINGICSVILPNITFECADDFRCSILNSNFDLQIKSNEQLIYSFHNLNFNGSNSGSTPLVAGLIIILSLISLMALL